MSSPAEASAFPPARAHGALSRLAEDLFSVRGTFAMAPGFIISRTMAIVRAGDELTLLNSVRLTEDTEKELLALGRVAHVVKLSDAHGIDDPYYVKTYGATFWSLEGAHHPKLSRDRILAPEGPIPGGKVLVIAGTKRPEAAYLVPQGGGTLVTCDVVQNFCDVEGASPIARLMSPLLGFKGGVIVPPMWRKMQGLSGERLHGALRPLAEGVFSKLIPGHGPAVLDQADLRVREAIRATGA